MSQDKAEILERALLMNPKSMEPTLRKMTKEELIDFLSEEAKIISEEAANLGFA